MINSERNRKSQGIYIQTRQVRWHDHCSFVLLILGIMCMR